MMVQTGPIPCKTWKIKLETAETNLKTQRDFIGFQTKQIATLEAKNERLLDALKLSLNILEMADDYIPEEGYNAYLVALSTANTALEAGDEGAESDDN